MTGKLAGICARRPWVTPKARVKVCAAFRPRPDDTTTAYAKQALRILARRYQTLTTEITELDTHINRLCVRANPALLATPGVGADTAATLLIAAGDNPHRLPVRFREVFRPDVHIRNTPKELVPFTGPEWTADKAIPSTVRVWRGSTSPSSQMREVAK